MCCRNIRTTHDSLCVISLLWTAWCAGLRRYTLGCCLITGSIAWRIKGEKIGTSLALFVKASLPASTKWSAIDVSVKLDLGLPPIPMDPSSRPSLELLRYYITHNTTLLVSASPFHFQSIICLQNFVILILLNCNKHTVIKLTNSVTNLFRRSLIVVRISLKLVLIGSMKIMESKCWWNWVLQSEGVLMNHPLQTLASGSFMVPEQGHHLQLYNIPDNNIESSNITNN